MLKTPSIHIIALLAFLANAFGPVPLAQAQEFRLPAPGVMVHLSPPLDPPILTGIKVDPDNPFRFDFILDQGDAGAANQAELAKLVKYFLASLTVPEKDLWVNLSPYEKNRIIPQSFGLTEMGRDLLAEDYMLKQITASLIYPEGEVGKKFWKRVYTEAEKKYGTTNIPVNTFNKVWIVPAKAVVYENVKAGTAYVVEAKLKVMLEEDYLSLEKHSVILSAAKDPGRINSIRDSSASPQNDINALGSQIVREIVIPELTKEVNEDKNFAQLRQVYNSLILATWYKKKIKDSILAQVYADKNKVKGVGYGSSNDVEFIYQRYLKAFKKGVFNYIKEETDPLTQETVPRKYFSGGFDLEFGIKDNDFQITHNAAMVNSSLNGLKRFFKVAISIAVVVSALLSPFSANATTGKSRHHVTRPVAARSVVKHSVTRLSPGALKVLQELNQLTPQQVEEITRTAFQSVADNSYAAGYGAVNINGMMKRLGVSFNDYYMLMYKALKDSPNLLEHFKNSSKPLGDCNREVFALILIEDTKNFDAETVNPKGGYDRGPLQIHEDKEKDPMKYLYEAIQGHWNTSMGIAIKNAANIMDVYGPSYMNFFGINEQELQFISARVEHNTHDQVPVQTVERAVVAIDNVELRGSIVPTKASLALRLVYPKPGKYSDIKNPSLSGLSKWGHVAQREADNDQVLLAFEQLHQIDELPHNEYEQNLYKEKEEQIRQEMTRFSSKYPFISGRSPSLAKFEAYPAKAIKFNVYPSTIQLSAEDLKLIVMPQVRTIAVSQAKRRIAILAEASQAMKAPRSLEELNKLIGPHSLGEMDKTKDAILNGRILSSRMKEKGLTLQESLMLLQQYTAMILDKSSHDRELANKGIRDFLVAEKYLLNSDIVGGAIGTIKFELELASQQLEFPWDMDKNQAMKGNQMTEERQVISEANINFIVKNWSEGGSEEFVVKTSGGSVFTFQHWMDKSSPSLIRHRINVFFNNERVGYIYFFTHNRGAWLQYNNETGFNSFGIDVDDRIRSHSRGIYKGVGRSLMGLAERLALLEGATDFYAVEVGWPIFENFYEKLGFKDSQPDLHYDSHQTIVKKLTQNDLSPIFIVEDMAMKVEKTGGIDFTANRTNLEIQNAGQGIKFHLDPAMLQQLQNAPGFTPVIISVKPLNDLNAFLGIVNHPQ